MSDPGKSKIASSLSEAMSIKVNMGVYDLRRQGHNPIVMSLGESLFDLPSPSFRELKNFKKGYSYSSSRGVPELREKIADLYREDYGVDVDPETEVIISTGSKPLIYMSLMATVNPGDEVIIFEPAWVSYVDMVKLAYCKPVNVPYYEGIYDLDKYITEKTKVVILNNPNNPIGKVYSDDELKTLYDLSVKNNFYILSDEAYSDFVDEEPFFAMARLDPEKKHIITANSLSKTFGISGWRIGYSITNPELTDLILRLNQHLITCPTTLIEYYLAEHFDEFKSKTRPQVAKILEKRKKAIAYMKEIGLEHLPGSATFYFAVSIEGSSLGSEDFAYKLLDKYHVSTVPGLGYGDSMDKFIRVSIGVETEERMKEGLSAIRKLIDETKV
ncbi:MAG: pyridoxal phosphate-dependent aminotransferase [Patescibacteria group bacterium]|nr:pyridoxal phosphate-dependent aminotransferase [Patescibacteria group bacterium]